MVSLCNFQGIADCNETFLYSFQAPYNNIRYLLLGEAAITQYFMIDSESGEVALRKSLMDDPNNRENYGVNINVHI